MAPALTVQPTQRDEQNSAPPAKDSNPDPTPIVLGICLGVLVLLILAYWWRLSRDISRTTQPSRKRGHKNSRSHPHSHSTSTSSRHARRDRRDRRHGTSENNGEHGMHDDTLPLPLPLPVRIAGEHTMRATGGGRGGRGGDRGTGKQSTGSGAEADPAARDSLSGGGEAASYYSSFSRPLHTSTAAGRDLVHGRSDYDSHDDHYEAYGDGVPCSGGGGGAYVASSVYSSDAPAPAAPAQAPPSVTAAAAGTGNMPVEEAAALRYFDFGEPPIPEAGRPAVVVPAVIVELPSSSSSSPSSRGDKNTKTTTTNGRSGADGDAGSRSRRVVRHTGPRLGAAVPEAPAAAAPSDAASAAAPAPTSAPGEMRSRESLRGRGSLLSEVTSDLSAPSETPSGDSRILSYLRLPGLPKGTAMGEPREQGRVEETQRQEQEEKDRSENGGGDDGEVESGSESSESTTTGSVTSRYDDPPRGRTLSRDG